MPPARWSRGGHQWAATERGRRLLLSAALERRRVHGAEWRGSDQHFRHTPVGPFDAVISPLEALCTRFPALRIERKPGLIALHFRQAPELEVICLDAMHEALERVDGMALLRGKMVIELKPRQASKAAAVRRFMEQSPFQHRRPWFFGDYITDESAFEAVLALGGVAVKVGAGDTMADYRLSSPAEVRYWIGHTIQHLGAVSGKGVAS